MKTDDGIRPECRWFDLWPLVESLLHDLEPVADTAGAAVVNTVPEDLVAFADANLLRRVLQNLLSNAIKYAPRGEITIAARPGDPPGTVECSVTDNGAGIADERQEAIFDKFASDPDMEGGTGLGLAIAKAFVEAHGGTLAVDSQEGVGSTFRFTLPGPTAARDPIAPLREPRQARTDQVLTDADRATVHPAQPPRRL